MKRRFLSAFLALVMAMSLLPMSAFAADEYSVGDTTTTTEYAAPENPTGFVWVYQSNATELICTEPTAPGETLICGHDEGHLPSCFVNNTNGQWVPCTRQTNPSHWEERTVGYPPFTYTDYSHVLDTGDGCWNRTLLWAMVKLLNVESYNKIYEQTSDWNLINFYHYVESEEAILTCGHEDNHTDACYGSTDGHVHSYPDCYTTTYTWILCADANGNGVDDATEGTYTITYTDGLGNILKTFNNVLVDTVTPTIDNPTRTNYSFNGWNPSVAQTVTADATYTATWVPTNDENNNNIPDEEETYTVTYSYTGDVPAGAPAVPAASSALYNTEVTLNTSASSALVENYYFSGWTVVDVNSNTVNINNGKFVMPDSNVTITGSWIEISKYSVSYAYSGDVPAGAPSAPTSSSYAEGSTVTVAEKPDMDGYVLTDWAASSISVANGKFTMPAKAVSFTAEWKVDVNNNNIPDEKETHYSVSYSYSGDVPANAPEVPATASYVAGAVVDVADKAAMSGYIVSDWTASGVSVTNGKFTMPEDNVTFSAQWSTDTNNNGTPDKDEICTVTVNITGEGAVKVNDTAPEAGKVTINTNNGEVNKVYVVMTPADGYYVSSLIVGSNATNLADTDAVTYKNCVGTYALPVEGGKEYTVTVGFLPMALDVQNAEITYYEGVSAPTADDVFDAIVTNVDPDDQGDYGSYKVEYLLAELSGKEYWAVVGGSITDIIGDIQSAVDNLNKIPGVNINLNDYLTTFDSAGEKQVRVTFESNNERYPDITSKVVTINLVDNRIATTVSGTPAEVVYGNFTEAELMTKIAPVVKDENGNVLSNVPVTIENIDEVLAYGVGERSVTITFAGNKDYSGSTATVTVTVTKAPVTVNVASQTAKYGQSMNTDPVTTTPAGVKTFDFVVGLDAHDETNLTYVAQVTLPIDKEVANWLKGKGVDLSKDMTMTELKEALGYLSNINDYIADDKLLEAVLGDYAIDSATVTTLMNALGAVIEYLPEGASLQIQVTTDLEMPKNVGMYLVGGVTADPNYQTAFNVGYLVITPNGIKVTLDWNYKDENGILTLPAYNAGSFDLTANATIDQSTVEGGQHPDDPEDHINYLFAGVDKDLNLVLSETLAGKTGAYVEVAYLTNWDNVMYYAAPIARTLILTPGIADVAFIDENGNENYARVFTYDNSQKSMQAQVTVNGQVVSNPGSELTVTYVGVDGHAEGYKSTTPPTEAGVYSVIAVYIDRENGDVISAGSCMGVMVIEQAVGEFSLSDADYCYDGNQHFATVKNPMGFDYISIAINRDTNEAYVNLPADLTDHIGKLPADVQADINALVAQLDGKVDTAQAITTINKAIGELIAVDMEAEAEALIEQLLAQAQAEMPDMAALEAQIKAELEALKNAIDTQIPAEVKNVLKELISQANGSIDADAVEAMINAELQKYYETLPTEVVTALKGMVSDLVDEISSNSDVQQAVKQAEEIIAMLSSYNVPDAEEIVTAIVGAAVGALSQTDLADIVEEVIVKIEARGYAEDAKAMLDNIASIYTPNLDTSKFEAAIDSMLTAIVNKAENGTLEKDDLAQFDAALDKILTELQGVVSQMPNGTIYFGENPSKIGTYDCYAISIAANYKPVFAEATLVIHDHNYVGEVTTQPTCTEPGVKTYTCTYDASHSYTEPVDAKGHAYGDWAVTTEPTCTEKGVETRVCANDANHKETRDIEAKGHDWDNGVVTKQPTATETGIKTYTCKNDSSHTKTETIPATGDNGNTGGNTGGNGNGGGSSNIPDVPPALNGEEHFAYITGYPDGTVHPNGNITRAEVATIFFRLLDDNIRDGSLTSANVFTDVNAGDWYNTAISTMAALGIVNGRTATEFAPNANITRAEFATICSRFVDMVTDVECTFTDISGHWAEDYILNAVALGWVNGYEDDTFRPNKAITRAEAMTLINRVLQRIPESVDDLLPDMKIWSDNSNQSMWYYLAVQEATNSHEYEAKGDKYETWTTLTENPDWSRYQ